MSSSTHLSEAVVSPDHAADQLPVESAQTPESPVVAAPSPKLPYQANHQAELIHLQAEIEALLQQLQTLKQQRTIDADDANNSIEAKLVASR